METHVNKLPALTVPFWILKIAATTLGETAGDLLSMTLNVGYVASSVILFTGFLVAVGLQLRATRYIPALYWLVILATSTSGTTISDMMDRTFELGYPGGRRDPLHPPRGDLRRLVHDRRVVVGR